jgi:hypothetical protein
MTQFPFLRWDPWIGSQYGTSGLNNRRLLIVGESHYVGSQEELERNRTDRGLTKDVVKLQWSGESWSYFTKIAYAVTGANSVDKRDFWNQVAFYNYVQDIVGVGARGGPSKALWEQAADLLPQVIDILQPDYIFATGVRLWEHLPSWPDGPYLKFEDQEWQTCVGHTRSGRGFRATYMLHPSSSHCGAGMRWAPLVRDFLNLSHFK